MKVADDCYKRTPTASGSYNRQRERLVTVPMRNKNPILIV